MMADERGKLNERIRKLEIECEQLRSNLIEQSVLQNNIEVLKLELETSLETHRKLQKVALTFEEENRKITEKYNSQLRHEAIFNQLKIELEHDLETKQISYNNLEKRYEKMREKLENAENLEVQVYNLEKDNRKKTEQIQELKEEMEAYQQGKEWRQNETAVKLHELTKENKEQHLKLETYIEEMEEMDTRVDQLEKENKLLQKQLKRINNGDKNTQNLQDFEHYENETKDLELKLKTEILKREIAENELFKLEEEFEDYKLLKESQNRFNNHEKSSLRDRNDNSLVDNDDVNKLLRNKQIIIENLDGERKEMAEKITSLEQEHEVLLEENSTLAKDNEEIKEEFLKMDDEILKLNKEAAKLTKEVIRLNNEVASLTNELTIKDNKLSQLSGATESKSEDLSKIKELQAKICDYESSLSQQQNEENTEFERVKLELSAAQEYLKLATQCNTELQGKLMRSEEETDSIKIRTKSVGAQSMNRQRKYEMEIEKIKEREKMLMYNHECIMNQVEQERAEYNNKIFDLNIHIQTLEERVTAMRTFYEGQSSETQDEPESTPPIPIRNGRLCHSMDDLDAVGKGREFAIEEEITDCLSDRELRRIAFKISASNWSTLPNELTINKHDVIAVLNSNSNDQEKVYRILVSWRSEHNQPRKELLKRLIESLDPKRKEVIRFLKEMNGQSSKDVNGIKTRFQKLKKSVRHSVHMT